MSDESDLPPGQVYQDLYQYHLNMCEYHCEGMRVTSGEIKEREAKENEQEVANGVHCSHHRDSTGGSSEGSYTNTSTRNTSIDSDVPFEVTSKEVDPEVSDDSDEAANNRSKGKGKETDIREVHVQSEDGDSQSPLYVLGPYSFEQALREEYEQRRDHLSKATPNVVECMSPVSEEESSDEMELLSSSRTQPPDPQSSSPGLEEKARNQSRKPKMQINHLEEKRKNAENSKQILVKSSEKPMKVLRFDTEVRDASIPKPIVKITGPEAFATHFINDGLDRHVSVRDILLHMDENKAFSSNDFNEDFPFCIIDRLSPKTKENFAGATVYWSKTFTMDPEMKYAEVGVSWYTDRSTPNTHATRYRVIIRLQPDSDKAT